MARRPHPIDDDLSLEDNNDPLSLLLDLRESIDLAIQTHADLPEETREVAGLVCEISLPALSAFLRHCAATAKRKR